MQYFAEMDKCSQTLMSNNCQEVSDTSLSINSDFYHFISALENFLIWFFLPVQDNLYIFADRFLNPLH